MTVDCSLRFPASFLEQFIPGYPLVRRLLWKSWPIDALCRFIVDLLTEHI